MDENFLAIFTLVITTIGTGVGAYFKSNISTMTTRIEHLEADNAELKEENKALRHKLVVYQEKVEDLLRQLAAKDHDSGIF